MKKGLIVSLALIAVLALPLTVFAAKSDSEAAKNIRSFFGQDPSKMNEQQKSDAKDYSQKMANIQKEYINKMVENGSITQEQANDEIARIEKALENGDGILPGFRHGKGREGGRFGKGGPAIDYEKLNEEQKALLTESFKSLVSFEKEYINKMVSSGILTSAQGESSIKRIDEMSSRIEKDGLNEHMGLPMLKGLGFMPGMGRGNNNLTEEQKAVITEYKTKFDNLKKEILVKLVENGTLSQEQADLMAKMNENKGNWPDGPQSRKGSGMKGRPDSNCDF